MTSHKGLTDLERVLPPHLTHGTTNHTPEGWRDILAATGRADPEAAHGIEDDIAKATIAAIAAGCPAPRQLATDAATVLSADYERWWA